MQSPTLSSRKQIIVVVTNGGIVLCFDNKLKLIWETYIRHSINMEVSILITYHSIRIDDLGSVILGCKTYSEFNETFLFFNKNENNSKDTSNNESHFSFYAFDGRTGSLRWKHEKEDFYLNENTLDSHNNNNNIDDLPSQNNEFSSYMNLHSYKLHILNNINIKHIGEVDWIKFEDDIIQQLPYYWKSKYDTKLKIAHFEKKRNIGISSRKTKYLNEQGIFLVKKVNFLIYIDKSSDFITKPNVIIAYINSGLEIIHLFTGRTLCKLDLNREILYDDINGDGIIESVQIIEFSHINERVNEIEGNQFFHKNQKKNCLALVRAGIPPKEQLFNVSICFFNNIFWELNPLLNHQESKQENNDLIKIANPITLK